MERLVRRGESCWKRARLAMAADRRPVTPELRCFRSGSRCTTVLFGCPRALPGLLPHEGACRAVGEHHSSLSYLLLLCGGMAAVCWEWEEGFPGIHGHSLFLSWALFALLSLRPSWAELLCFSTSACRGSSLQFIGRELKISLASRI